MLKKGTSKSALMVALATGNVIWGGTVVHAEEPSQAFTLDPMVVTAQRMETRDLDTPAAVTVISSEEIKKSGAVNVDTLLAQQIGFNGMSYGPNGQEYGGSASRTKIRGLDKGTLVLVNGAPMNLLNYNAISNIPLDSIEKIEIVRGSNATLYGAEAMGGVINIITKKASGSAKTTISGTIGNYTDKWSVGHQNEYFSVYYDKDYYDEVNPQTRKFPYGEYASSSGSKKNNYNTLGKSRKESIFITGNIGKNLTLNYNHSKSDLNRFQITRSKAAADKLGTSYKYDDNRDTASLVYDDTSNKLKSVFSFNSRWFTSNQKKSNEKEFSVSGGSYKMFNITSDTQKGWSFNGDKDSLIAGIAIKRDFYQNYKYTFQKSDRTSLGLYTSYTHQFAPKFSATLGLRGEAINDFDTDQNVFLPQLQTLYKFNENLTWYTNIGKSFIMPAMNSQFYTTDKDAHNLKKSRGLKPQEGWTYETGMKKITNSSSLKLAVFNMDISNKFGWASEEELGIGTNTTAEIQINKGDFRNTGIEVEYTKLVGDNWRYNLGVTYSNPEINDSGEWVQDNARLQFVAGIGYQKNKFNAGLNYLFLGDRNDSYYHEVTSSGNRYYVLPNRNIMNATLQYSADKNNSVALNFYNILDKKDVVNDYENYGLPFNWTLTYNYSF